MSDANEKEPKRELTDIRPRKVSLVDLGANDEMFFIAKGLRIEGEQTDVAKAVTSYLQGISMRVAAMTELLKSAEADDDNGVVSLQFSALLKRAAESVSDVKSAFKQDGTADDVAISCEARDKMVTMLDVIAEKVAVADDEIRKSDDDGVTEGFLKSIDEIAVAFDSVTTSYDETEMAVWTRAFINDLPDSAFLYIAPGGTKDDEGKTKPRTLRKFPYKNKEGKVDLPHLRNAIARIPQSNLSQALKDKLQAKARRILAANTEKQKSEETMSDRIKALIKSAGDVQLDLENVKKQTESAIGKLQEVIETLNVDTKKVDELWDLKWKIGDAISMLIDAAALDSILGPMEEVSDSHGGDRDEEETEMSEEKTEKSVEEEAAKSSDSSEEQATEKAAAGEPEGEAKETEKAKPKVEPAPAPAPAEDVASDGDKLAATIAGAVTAAMAPVREAVDALQETVTKQAEKIEKMDNDRAVAKGAGPDETQGNIEGDDGASEPKSQFTGLMPPHLQGTYAHGQKVED